MGSASRLSAAGGRRVPAWLFWLPLLGVAAWGVRHMQQRAESAGLLTVMTDRARLDPGREWVDPRWEEELRGRLATMNSIDPGDRAARQHLASAVQALSFVEQVGEPAVIWPDGLRLELRLHQPVACVPVRGGFLPVARDGTLLSGRWSAPPRRESGWLPVLGPADDLLEDARAGERLERPYRLAALATARSLFDCLGPAALRVLGRVTIDARKAHLASPEEPGTLLLMEGSRVVVFGRSADTEQPGELPVELKWESLTRALELLDKGDLDWELLDVRWDRPELRSQEPAEGLREG